MARSISQPVGIRYGTQMMPNQKPDVMTICDLLDSIPIAKGGCLEIGGVWSTQRDALIAEVTGEIVTFQTVNKRPQVDGVVDPGGGTLRLMNQLAVRPGPSPGPPADGISAQVVETPAEGADNFDATVLVASPHSLGGKAPLEPRWIPASYKRKLVRVEGSSIRWFGVVVPSSVVNPVASVPHINFTPTPIQGGYQDGSYTSFGGWGKLWADYTGIIGGQVAASGVDQILVIPIYRTAQYGNLGSFLTNWKECVTAVIRAALSDIRPSNEGSNYSFQRIYSSSFSNGWVTHHHFHISAVDARGLTAAAFDLDGAAAHPPSAWQPAIGASFANQPPGLTNPLGQRWFVGRRWGEFSKFYGNVDPSPFSHALCRDHLLYPGLTMYCLPQIL